jgi:hypothetical protein
MAMDTWVEIEPDAGEIQELLARVMLGVNGQAFRLFGDRVLSGPFAGMIIPQRSPWDDGNSGAKLLGCYEHELHESIHRAVRRRPGIVVNVGCAEGYYAIGMARMMSDVVVHAFDTSCESLSMCDRYAHLNEVAGKLILQTGCRSPQEMNIIDQRSLLYIIDCEGDEDKLIDLEQCPALMNSDIIVECHDFLRAGIGFVVAEKLSDTHEIEFIQPKLPDLNQFQFMRQFPTVMSALMAVEKRPMPCYWLACWANSKGNGNG